MNFISKNMLAIALLLSGSAVFASERVCDPSTGVLYEPVFYGPEAPQAPGLTGLCGILLKTLFHNYFNDAPDGFPSSGTAFQNAFYAIPGAIKGAAVSVANTEVCRGIWENSCRPVTHTGYHVDPSTDNALALASRALLYGGALGAYCLLYKKSRLVKQATNYTASLTYTIAQNTAKAVVYPFKALGNAIVS